MLRILRCAVWLAVAGCWSSSTSGPAPTPTTPAALGTATTISGYAGLPRQPMGPPAVDGTVTLLDSAGTTEDTQHWRVELTSTTNQRAVYLINLPAAMNMPFMKDERLKIEMDVVGGGPNERQRIVVVDDKGALRLAIDRLPATWKADFGTPGKLDKGDDYDEQDYAVRVQSPSGAAAELDRSWRIVTLDGVRYHGKGNAAKRTLKSDIMPPDYVSKWIDFALVAIEDAP